MEFNLDMSRRILGSVVVPSCSFLIYNRNRPRTLNAKSQFNFEKYQTHPTRIKVKFRTKYTIFVTVKIFSKKFKSLNVSIWIKSSVKKEFMTSSMVVPTGKWLIRLNPSVTNSKFILENVHLERKMVTKPKFILG